MNNLYDSAKDGFTLNPSIQTAVTADQKSIFLYRHNLVQDNVTETFALNTRQNRVARSQIASVARR